MAYAHATQDTLYRKRTRRQPSYALQRGPWRLAMTRLGMVLYHGIESGPQLKEYAEFAEAAGYESLWVTERYFHEETFALLALLAGQRVNTTAGRLTLRDARLAITPVQHALPIYVAAIGPRALRLAGAVADGVLLNAYVPPGYVRYAVQEIRQAARAAGRDPQAIDIACMLVVRLTNDLGQMLPSLKQRLVRLLEEPYVGEILLDKGGFDPALLEPLRTAAAQGRQAEAASLVSEAMVEAFYLAGTATHCRARLAEYRAAGVDLPLLLPRLEDYQATVEALRGEGNQDPGESPSP